MRRLVTLSLALPLLFALSFGSVGCGGGGATVKQNSTTLGQQLEDLHSAYEQGIITEKQYEKKKKELLKNYK
ncbi:MAG: SHOCT domain-containing protein [Deltaproteobacteria bacterium]|nr:SHOCT domain-containing protein [Deltaproteobacteria bacterium]MBW2417588.1 SHOCT domain-containing protein [Deltaproteobacteria bacterium]